MASTITPNPTGLQLIPPYPAQHQNQQPGIELLMTPRPVFDNPNYKGSGKLKDKVALITGGDSGQGRAIAVAYAKEGADVVIVYLNEHADAEDTKQFVEQKGRQCLSIAGDIGNEAFCKQVVEQTVKQFGKLDILVNNAAEQHVQNSLGDITSEQMEQTFRTNFFSVFFLSKAALAHMKPGSAIINAASLTAYEGNEQLIDYSATKGAIVAFTRSLSKSLHSKGIRVNGVVPGTIWTPLIPASFPADQVANWGAKTPKKRAGQPYEIAPAYVYFAYSNNPNFSYTLIETTPFCAK
ncbi:SDR family oxidoreductase [Paenibacillus alginolyticus]|uniref:SDR family oxidoreductase n=1 Tax=Paenibacillus alginolyticus TaxID=59839 RepID=A0ABT4GEX6_9BACL|nr:SDR family oxidoreductase [Paenibacillus alginolyticus]MCY9664184.1 SDR family oxidoreductase [Paenibacillus alginolyticus]MCY9694741.1 SDR family oxidoreductase [Paenibacillus alginolyticus]MEC0147088.1 SDR family oxidoreductase [Paenibacillus alginolyticus]